MKDIHLVKRFTKALKNSALVNLTIMRKNAPNRHSFGKEIIGYGFIFIIQAA